MLNRGTHISNELFFTTQQKTNGNICHILLLFIVISNGMKIQMAGIQFNTEKKASLFHCIFIASSIVISLLMGKINFIANKQ
jgi:hypothetical protein